jgi:RNA polymerase sigma-70 factor (ECF subfamily)
MDIPHAEIAVRLGISKNMVERHVMNAMRRCRERVEDPGDNGHTNPS